MPQLGKRCMTICALSIFAASISAVNWGVSCFEGKTRKSTQLLTSICLSPLEKMEMLPVVNDFPFKTKRGETNNLNKWKLRHTPTPPADFSLTRSDQRPVSPHCAGATTSLRPPQRKVRIPSALPNETGNQKRQEGRKSELNGVQMCWKPKMPQQNLAGVSGPQQKINGLPGWKIKGTTKKAKNL